MSSGNLTRNSIYNLLGNGLPLIVSILTIPRLVHVLGVDRYGVLTLTWVVMGYFSLFDLGLGRALTQIVAERTAKGECGELPDIIRTALTMMLILGILGGACLGIASPLIVGRVLKTASDLHRETLYAFGLIAISIPAVTVVAGLRGILEARHRFLEINILRLWMGVLTFLGPWLVSFKTVNLFWIVLSLEAMRYGALIAYFLTCRKIVPEMAFPGTFQRKHWTVLAKFGGWMTVSNIISPLMVSMDRFFIGIFVSVGAIAYYSTPFDMITKAFAISNAFVSVLFPMFGSLYLINKKEVIRLYDKGMKTIFWALAPILVIIGIGSRFVLSWWLGADFAEKSALVLEVLCLGVLINALAAVPYAFIQGVARPDLTAKFHLGEAPVYLLILWILGSKFGILGVAWAWTLRVAIDYALLHIAARRLQKVSHA